ncbi:MAG: lytic transglycosylase domain-containing protein [Oligoflexia bacterium]|nr:lytic transglycosylase domain-containing protein [Oligoflexia bacterium]
MKKKSNQVIIAFFILVLSFQSQADIKAPTVALPPVSTRNFDTRSYDLILEKFKTDHPEENNQLWALYTQGQHWQSEDILKACEIFKKLSLNEEFPLHAFSLINEALTCKYTTVESARSLFEKINKFIEVKKPKRWLHSALVDASVPLAYLLGPETYVNQCLNASKLSRSRKNKTLYLQNALSQAKKISVAKFNEIQKELYRLAPRLNPKPEDWFSVGLDATYSHDHEAAVIAYEKALKQKSVSIHRTRITFENLKLAYKAIQKKPEALATAGRLWKYDTVFFKSQKGKGDTTKNFLSSGLSFARFEWTEHKDKKALKLLSTLEKMIKNKIPTGEINFVRSLIFQEQEKMKPALLQMELATQNTDPKNKLQFQWHNAWLNFKLKNYDTAISIFNLLLSTEQDLGRRAQQIFWLGKAYQATNQPELAKAKFEELQNVDPLSYYSLLAYRELKLPIPKPTSLHAGGFTKLPKKFFSSTEVSWTLFDWLISVRELKHARQFLDEESPLPDVGIEDWQNIFQQYAKAGSYAAIFGKISKLTSEERTKILVENPEFLFPKPYKELIDSASAQTGLWPEFILSIMRQESSFDTLSVSPANAFGLMQILPLIAKQYDSKTGLRYKEPQDLLDPVLSVNFGAQHLRNYWDLFNGQFVLASAAYNASPEAIQQWIKKRYRGDPLIFIEDIPYEETRTYVKLIMRNFINYLRLYSQGETINFPEWCLEDIQASNL